MGKDQDWKNLGEQILDSVAGALNSGDFSKLNDLVSDTVNNAVQEAKKQADIERLAREGLNRRADQARRQQERWQRQMEDIYRRREERRQEWRNGRTGGQTYVRSGAVSDNVRQEERRRRPPKAQIKFRRVGSVANVLYTVFGALGIGCSFAFLLVTLALSAAGGVGGVASVFGFLTLLTGFGFGSMMKKGAQQRKLLKLAQRYISICGSKMYANVEDLASQTGQSARTVVKNIRKMLSSGMFPEGHLDERCSCFMLNDEVYRQYIESSEAFKMREQEKNQQAVRQKTPEEQAAEEQQRKNSELDAMFAEGTEYIRKLRNLNDQIPGEEISAQLYQLESLLKQIFDRVKEHPEQMGRMQKLMEYYLPTTLKLVEAYVDFEKVEKPGQDIVAAKAEIQKTLGIINEAFEELLNNLFQDAVFDATTDAQVLQTMLSREGLRREMSAEPAGNAPVKEPVRREAVYEETVIQRSALDSDVNLRNVERAAGNLGAFISGESLQEEEEENPFAQTESEEPEVQVLRAPWES